MQYCFRPHCSIRSHNHGSTFADFLELCDYYRDIARSFKDDTSQKNIENYELLSDNLSKYDRYTCFKILKNILVFFESANSVDSGFKQLLALYVFSMCRTLHMIKFMHLEKPNLREAVHGAYYRLLKQGGNNKHFVSEMEKLVPF